MAESGVRIFWRQAGAAGHGGFLQQSLLSILNVSLELLDLFFQLQDIGGGSFNCGSFTVAVLQTFPLFRWHAALQICNGCKEATPPFTLVDLMSTLPVFDGRYK